MADYDRETERDALSPEEAIANKRNRIESKSIIKGFFLKVIVVAGIVYLFFRFVFGIAAVSGESMYPSLRDGDVTLYYRLESDYIINDVLTFSKDGTRYFGRVVAVQGDTVDITDDGRFRINGNVQHETGIYYETFRQEEATVNFPYTVENGSVFVLCDFRTGGTDSREFGAVEKSEIDGKLIAVLRRRDI